MRWEGLFNTLIAICLDQVWQGPLITNASMSRSDMTDILPGTVGKRRLGLKQGGVGGVWVSSRLPSEPVEKHTGEEVLLLYPHRGQEFGCNLYLLLSTNFVTRSFCVYVSLTQFWCDRNWSIFSFHDRIIKPVQHRKFDLKNQRLYTILHIIHENLVLSWKRWSSVGMSRRKRWLGRARLCWSLVAKHRRGSIESQPTAATSNTFFLIEVDSRSTILKGQCDQFSRK